MLTLQQHLPAQATYTDPSIRLSGPRPQTPPTLAPQQQQEQQQQQQQPLVIPQGQVPPPAPVAGAVPRPTTDGLGLLLEAFDTHQTAAAPAQSVPETNAPGAPPPPPGTVYDPQAAPQQYLVHPQPALAMNDGYEHELGYYMSDGVPPPAMQQPLQPQQPGWAGGGDMYGY
ncbi:hypothetical protein VTG60DRAFT_4743 [Thermothelomyces hinnuleus]